MTGCRDIAQSGVADVAVGLAATPTFALMALLTYLSGGSAEMIVSGCGPLSQGNPFGILEPTASVG